MQLFVVHSDECVHSVYADQNVVRRSQTVIETCTEDENPFYISHGVLCACVSERERYMYI